MHILQQVNINMIELIRKSRAFGKRGYSTFLCIWYSPVRNAGLYIPLLLFFSLLDIIPILPSNYRRIE